jgi:hypothetical protein
MTRFMLRPSFGVDSGEGRIGPAQSWSPPTTAAVRGCALVLLLRAS